LKDYLGFWAFSLTFMMLRFLLTSHSAWYETAISLSDPTRFHALSGSLDFEHQALAHGLAQHAEERRKEIEKEAMEKAAAGGVAAVHQ
jgi:hypothetical protein